MIHLSLGSGSTSYTDALFRFKCRRPPGNAPKCKVVTKPLSWCHCVYMYDPYPLYSIINSFISKILNLSMLLWTMFCRCCGARSPRLSSKNLGPGQRRSAPSPSLELSTSSCSLSVTVVSVLFQAFRRVRPPSSVLRFVVSSFSATSLFHSEHHTFRPGSQDSIRRMDVATLRDSPPSTDCSFIELCDL